LSRIYQDRFLFSWVPIIVQIHGYCIGGAMMLQLACDISIAADDALVGYTEQRMGFGGNAMDMGALTMAVGSKKAQLLLLTGAMLSGKEAAEMGLISKSVPPDRLEAEVEEAAQTIARMPRDGVAIGRAAKEMVYHSLGISGDRAIGYVSHTLFSNLRWEDDEFNFFKQRRESGTGDAIKSRNEFFGDT
jgi:enoyl-CoA hydratase